MKLRSDANREHQSAAVEAVARRLDGQPGADSMRLG